MHIPVLLNELVESLDLKSGGTAIDGTAGSGGHAREILKRVGKTGKLLLVDWDKENIANLKKEFRDFPNVLAVHGNYADLPEIMEKNNFPKAGALALDLGFSSEQLEKGRGFSFRKAEPLIMTYSDENEPLSEFLKRAAVGQLTEIIWKYGEERYARRIAEAILADRENIKTSLDLANAIKKAVPISYQRSRIHPATRTFQALRIYLNKELDNLEKILGSLAEILRPKGRAAIISFHSLEDRVVKTAFREMEKKGKLKIINKKIITPSVEEIKANPRSRSAKLRVGELL